MSKSDLDQGAGAVDLSKLQMFFFTAEQLSYQLLPNLSFQQGEHRGE